mgnify:CR=1 FL=1
MRVPSKVPATMGALGFPNGVSRSYSFVSSSPDIPYKPEPPMIAIEIFSVILFFQSLGGFDQYVCRKGYDHAGGTADDFIPGCDDSRHVHGCFVQHGSIHGCEIFQPPLSMMISQFRMAGGYSIIHEWDVAARVAPKCDLWLRKMFKDGRPTFISDREADSRNAAGRQRDALFLHLPPQKQ